MISQARGRENSRSLIGAWNGTCLQVVPDFIADEHLTKQEGQPEED